MPNQDKSPKIGLGNAWVLCGMKDGERLGLIAEGLPLLLESAQGFWQAAVALGGMPREREVLIGLAEEEAAKILILVDVVRCPARVVGNRIGPMVRWFYDHLARLLYSEAQSWQPTDLRMLQDYLDQKRRGHHVEGFAGEYILPNDSKHFRESLMYADIALQESGEPFWNRPTYPMPEVAPIPPKALRTTEALSRLGLLSSAGLKLVADVWRGTPFVDDVTAMESDRLVRVTVERCIELDLPRRGSI